jgi:hypothetical protein
VSETKSEALTLELLREGKVAFKRREMPLNIWKRISIKKKKTWARL